MAWFATSTGSAPKPARRDGWPCLAAALACAAAAAAAAAAAPEPELLPAEQAFRLSARALDDKTLEARFEVADGYYLYRDKLRFAVEPETAGVAMPALPPGKVKDDAFFGQVETYRGEVVAKLPLAKGAPGQSLVLVADSQGCADLGVCYPVNRQKVTLVLPAAGKGPGPVVEANPRKKAWFR